MVVWLDFVRAARGWPDRIWGPMAVDVAPEEETRRGICFAVGVEEYMRRRG